MILLVTPVVPAAPTVKRLTDNVYMMSEFHYTSLVVGEDGVLITDPAFPGRAQSLKRAIADITDKPVTRIVLSHEHYDHVGGTGVFPEAQVICRAACQAVFDLDVGGMAPEKVDVTFTDSLRVDTGHRWTCTTMVRAMGSPPSWCICPRSASRLLPTSMNAAR